MTEEKNTIKGVQRGFNIIESLREMDGATVTGLASELDLPKSTAYVYLNSLREAGYIVKDDSVYRVSLRFLEHGGYARRQLRLYRVAKAELKALAERTDEAANLGVEERGKRVLLKKARTEKSLSDNAVTGERTHMHQTALGKAILSHLSEERVDQIIDRHGLPAATQHSITEPAALRTELEEIRERGYSIEDEEHRLGILAVGVPIEDRQTNRVVGSVCLTGPKARLAARIQDELVDEVVRTSNIIELKYNHH